MSDNEIDEQGELATFFVPGIPKAKGSFRAFIVGKGRAQHATITNHNPATAPWEQRVALFAANANEQLSFFNADKNHAYAVWCFFYMPAPKSLREWQRCNKRPDLDKLVRTVLDGITGSLIPDDAQIVEIKASKQYAADDQPGVRIAISRKQNAQYALYLREREIRLRKREQKQAGAKR